MINVIQLTGESAKVFGEYVVCNISNMNFSSISTNDVIDIETINLEDVFDAKNVEFPSGTTVIGYIVVTAI